MYKVFIRQIKRKSLGIGNGGRKMLNRIMVSVVGLMAVLTLSSSAFAQTAQSQQSGAAKPQKEASSSRSTP